MKKIILVLSILMAHSAMAKTLVCNDGPSFTNQQFSINRDGSIGFNGTYISLQAGIWTDGPRLSDLTGRSEDNIAVHKMELAISPKEACTLPDAELGVPFHCSAKNVNIIAVGERTKITSHPDIFDRITIRSQLHADVEIDFSTPVVDESRSKMAFLKGTVIGLGKKPVTFSIGARNQDHCKITDN